MAVQLDTKPFWMDLPAFPRFPRLEEDESADVVVVGGGITGLTAAYLLSAAGRSVALVERRRLGEVDTGHTTAHLTMVTDTPITELVKRFGNDHARAVWDAGLAAISQIDELVRDHELACEFEWVPAYLHATGADEAAEELSSLEEQASRAAELGFDAAFVQDVPLVHVPGIRFADQARFHPRKYLALLANAITVKGGRIYGQSETEEFCEKPRFVKANGAKISCDYVVVATHNPLIGLESLVSATLLQTKLALYTSYAVAGEIAKDKVPDALLWDTGDPYHYLRVTPRRDHDLVIYGGEDHKTGQAADTTACYHRLEKKLLSLVPDLEISHRWSGQVIETPDGLPYIGETADRQFVATGFSGNGMTFGTLAGMMAADRVLGRPNPWTDLFDPARKTLSAAWDYFKENRDYPYYLIRDRFAGAEARSIRAVRRGQGKIVDYRGQQVAAYRDEDGSTRLLSPVCTHMGCVVGWNEAERTWDCPCHGSRFETDGTVISGPAETPLPPVESES